jgi:sn-glycerol 3-phosphate transport system ATP-binding protein
MADRLVVLCGGRSEQLGTPLDVYHAPASVFVAGFIGSPAINMIKAGYLRDTGTTEGLRHLFIGVELIGICPDDLLLTPPDMPHLYLTGRIGLLEPAVAKSHI